MPRKIREMQLNYVTNKTCEKTAVILPIEELLENLADMTALLECEEPTIPFEKILINLKLS